MKKIVFAFFAAFLMALSSLAFAAVDLNSATAQDLQALKGVGPAKAKAIIEYRDKNGPFKSVDELDKVKGFSAKTVEKLRSELTIDGAAPPPAVPPKAAPAPVAAPAPKPVPGAKPVPPAAPK